MNLYEISRQYLAVTDLEDIPPEAIRDTLESIEGEFDDKAVNLVKYSKNIDADCSEIDKEIDRLKAIKKIKQNAVERLREYLRENMEATGITKIEHPLFKITLTKPRPMVEVTDEEALPDDCVKTEVVVKADKNLILKMLKEGKAVPGAKLVDSKPGLRIT